MCGICGILGRFTDRGEQETLLLDMTSVIQHRGPDGWGSYLSPDMALGQTRLSIIDVATGHQPMVSEHSAIAFNGEIYNHVELRADLRRRGFKFKTHCDTEVLQVLLETEGPQSLTKLNGQFAILWWDRKNESLLIARDRYGTRPLYVLEHDDRYFFSSEMKSFDTIKGFTRKIAPARLLEHAIFWNTLLDETVYENIRSVETGTYEIFGRGERRPARFRFYQIGDTAKNKPVPTDFKQTMEAFTAQLQESVDLRLRADVPVGAYLSGGIDSTVIAHLTKKRKKDDFETFSIGFADKEFDESVYQKEVSEHISSDHIGIEASRESIEKNFMDSVYHTERPIFRTAPVPLFQLSERVRRSKIKVVLTGEGADEILFGYDSFKEIKILEQWKKNRNTEQLPELIGGLYPHLSHYSDPARFGMMKMYYEGFLDSFDNELVGLNIRASNNMVIARYLNQDLKISLNKEAFIDKLKEMLPPEFSSWSLLQRNSFLEIKTLLQGYLLSSQGDRMALAHSIEGRYPFLDHNLVDNVFYYPDHFKLWGFSQKHILREAFRGKVPSSVIDRAKRPYMAPDLVSFFKDGKLTEIAAHFLSEKMINEYGLFDPKFTARFIRKFEGELPKEIGYRDNMILTFLLSAQVATHWARNPRKFKLDKTLRTVNYIDYMGEETKI